MNEKSPQNEREKLERKLTALLLGELPAHDEAALHRAMDEDPELAALYERLKVTIELVRSAESGVRSAESGESAEGGGRLGAPKSDEGGSTELKLPPEKREKLLAHFKTVRPKEFVEAPSKRVLFDNRRNRILEWAAVAAVVVILAALSVPNFVRSRDTSRKNTLIHNLRLLDGAKQTWALEANASINAIPSPAQVAPYFGRGGTMETDFSPIAMPGVKYVVGKAGEAPGIETSISQARRWMGGQRIPEDRVHNGQVELSMGELMDQKFEQNPAPQVAMNTPWQTRFVGNTTKSAPSEQGGSTLGVKHFDKGESEIGGGLDASTSLEAIRAARVAAKGGEERQAAAQPLTPREQDQTATFGLDSQSASLSVKSEIVLPASNEATGNEQLAMNEQRQTAAFAFYGLATNYQVASSTDSWEKNFAAFNPQAGETVVTANDTSVTNSIAGDSEWIGILEPPEQSHTSNSAFVARYASIVVPQTWAATVSGATNYTAFDLFDDKSAGAGGISNLLAKIGASNDSYNPQFAYRMLSRSDAGGGQNDLTINYTNLVAGTVRRAEAEIRADDEAERLRQANRELSESKAPILGDIPKLGAVIQGELGPIETNGQVYTGLSRDDVSGLRYLATNGVVASQPIDGNGGTMNWNAFDGSTNKITVSGIVVQNDGDLGLVGTNISPGGLGGVGGATTTSTDQSMSLASADTALREAMTQLSANDGRITSGLRNSPSPMHEIALPSMGIEEGGGDVARNVKPSRPSRHAIGGKQVEMAAAAQSEARPKARPQMTPIANKPPDGAVNGTEVASAPTGPSQPAPVIEAIRAETNAPAPAPPVLSPAPQSNLVYSATVVGYSPVNISNSSQFSLVAPSEQEKKVELAQAKVDELRKQLNISDENAEATGPSPLMSHKTLEELTSQKVQLQADYEQQSRLLEKLKSMNQEDLKKTLPVAVADNQLNTLLSEQDLAEQNLLKLKGDYSENDPKYQRAKSQVNDLNRMVNDRIDGIVVGLQAKVDSTEAQIDSIKGTIDEAQKADVKLAQLSAPYFEAKEKLEAEKRWRDILKMKTGEEQVDKDLPKARSVMIIDPATAAATEKPSFGEKLRQTVSGKVERAARITVEQEHTDIVGLEGPATGNNYDPYFLQTEFQTIKSEAVLKKAAEKLNADKNGSAAVTVAELKKDLDLGTVKNSKFIEIGAKGTTADEAARIANAVAQAYREYRLEEYDEIKTRGIKSLQDQLAEQDNKVELAQAKVDELAKQLSLSAGTASAEVVNQSDNALPKPAIPPPTPQPEMLTRENAFSTFSMNVSDVSFKLAAASLEKGQMPEPASIRSEEFINAFDYRDPEAAPGVPVAFNYERALYPFAHNRELLRFSLKTAAAGRQTGRPLNIVLLLDNSGSMERADRVRIIQEGLRVLAGQLQAQDTFSIVTFARTPRLRVDGIPGNQAAAAVDEVGKFTPEGGTDLGDALDVAYETALHHYLPNGDNRVVLLTDGAANLGDVDSNSLKQKVETHRKQGIALDCFGIGWEGYNDDLLEVLTRDGDGRYGFINTPEEASTEFVSQIAGALHVAAADVKVQVEFNPDRVISYRQIGYAKHQLTKEQFRDNTVAAGQIAAQEAGNALYTIEVNPQGQGSIGTVRVRYKVPDTGEIREQSWDVPYTGGAVSMEQASPAMRLATTASAFSEWLATSPFAEEVTTDQLLNYLNGVPQVYGADTRPQKLEWMIRQAKSISGK